MPGEAETASGWDRAGFVPPFGQGLDQVGLVPIDTWAIFLPAGKIEGEVENRGSCKRVYSLRTVKLFIKKHQHYFPIENQATNKKL